MKILFIAIILSFVSSASFASDICHVLGTGRRVGVGLSVDNEKVIYVEGQGSFKVIKSEENKFEADHKVSLDLNSKVLTVSGVRIHLESCFHTDAY